ncbi:MAG: TonB-dependent receptor [Bryobacterales bacterium]|nr:TonB-dependent receptor [Bryobacterales bacterium]
MSRLFLRLGIIVFLFQFAASGQEFRGSLQGQVADQTQAAIAGAEVTVKNIGTSVERNTTTDDQGRYLFQFLPPGKYSLTTRAQGFKQDMRENIEISLGENIRLDVALALGDTAETVTVAGEVSSLQTENAGLGSVLRQDIINSLPLKGHSSLFMFTLATGVVNNRYGEDTRPNDTITNVSYTSNGSPMASGDVSVDGVANTINVNRGVNISQWVPARFAVQEFKLQTGTLSAEHGRSGGNIMSLVIKSGTNQFHGDAYEFLRNAALDSNLFFNNAAGRRLARYGSNTYGASLGGPIFIPKLYNGHNRTFFFFNYEGSREGNGISPLISVPTARMRRGDFGEVPTAIFDPLSLSNATGTPTRTPFPNNVIPANAQDPVGRNIMNYWPEANLPGAGRSYVQNYAFSTKWPRDYEAMVVKIDQQFSSKNQMFVRVNRGEGRLVFPFDFEGIATSGRNNVKRPHLGIAISDTTTISPRTTLDIRLGYSRGIENNRPWSDGFDPVSLGFPSSFSNLIQSRAFPNISVSDFQPLANSPYIFDPGDTWSLQPAMTHQRGRHLLKFGGETRLIRGHFFRNLTPSGRFSFAPNQTGGPNAATPAGGFGLASMLVGFGSGALPTNTGVSIQNVYYGLYLQDDFRVNAKLTLNLGVRWEYESPRTERYDRTVRGFAFGKPSPLRVAGLNLTGGLQYAGVGGLPRGLYDTDRNNFAPRIGFAYSIRKGTVLRGGYALSYIPVIGSVLATGYSNDTPWVSSTDGGISVVSRLSNPFPSGLLPPVGNSLGLSTLLGQNVDFVEPTDRAPKFHNWNFNLQRELPSRGLIEVAYVGSRAISLISDTEQLNQLPTQFFSQGAALTQLVENPFFGTLSGALSGRTVQRQQLLRPYPQYTGVARLNPAFGNTVYHSVQIKYEKRMAAGLTGLVSYTISKNIGDTSTAQNAYDRRVERAVTNLDVPQRLTIAGAWDLPVGRGKSLAPNANPVVNYIIGGWQLSTFATFQAGFPTRFGVQGGTFPIGVGGVRPNVVGDPTSSATGDHGQRLGRYFNTDAFVRPADFTLGNLASYLHTVRSPGMNNLNLTLAKDFKIAEKAVMEFRASMFNAANHPVFSGPNTTVGNASFGRISGQANLSRQTEFGLRLTF